MFKTIKQYLSQNLFVVAVTLLFCLSLAIIAVHQKQLLSESQITSAIDSQSDINAVDSIADSQMNMTDGLMTADSKTVPDGMKKADEQTKAKVLETYGKLPLHFEPNNGQIDSADVKFTSHGDGYNLFLSPTNAKLVLSRPVVDSTDKENPQNQQNISRSFIDKELPKTENSENQNITVEKQREQSVISMNLVGANTESTANGVEQLSR